MLLNGFWTLRTYHLDLENGLVAVVQKIACFPTVYSDDSKEQLAAQTERQGSLARFYYSMAV